MAVQDRLSLTFAALADPTRRAILDRLRSGECSVGELAGPFSMSLPAVSKHLRVLERAGLITQTREAQWRRCRIRAEPLKEVFDWTEHYRQVWEARLDRLDHHLEQLQKKDSTLGNARSQNEKKGEGRRHGGRKRDRK